MSIKFAKGSGSMVEQRSPKPSVACSSRVSPAKRRSPERTSFSLQFFRDTNTQRNRGGTHSLRLRLHLTLRVANKFAMLRYISRFALSRVASPLPKEVLRGFFFSCIRDSNTQRIRDGTMSVRLWLRRNDVRAPVVATERCPCYLFIDYHFQSN